MKINKQYFGKTSNGKDVDCYILDNENGITAEILTLGGILKNFTVDGRDIVLGHNSIEGYEQDDAYLGALIGRTANRIGKGKFTIDGVEYSIPINNGPNTNHGGTIGFDKKVWDAEVKDNKLILSLISEDIDQGFPGNLNVQAIYSINDNDLVLEFLANTDKTTPINLTAHHYFNLSEEDTILDHDLKINSNVITQSDDDLLPTGKILNIRSTPLDFTERKKVAEAVEAIDYTPIKQAKGIDHNYIFKDEHNKEIVHMADLENDDLRLSIFSDQPGMQVYSGNFLDQTGKREYKNYSGIAFEPQNWPDSINKPNFPDMTLSPGETYSKKIIYKVDRK